MTVITGIAVISSVLYLVVKKYSPEYSLLVEIASIILILWFAYPYICDIIDFYSDFSSLTGVADDWLKILLKSVGVALLTQFSADVCRDSGENAMAAKIEFAGKTVLIALSLPMAQALLEFAVGLIKE